jgi:hypothetical protein
MLLLSLLLACGNSGSDGRDDGDFKPLTFDVLDGTMGLVNGSDGAAECDPAGSCFEEGMDAFLVIDATANAVTVTVPRVDELDAVWTNGTPYDIVSGGVSGDVDPEAGLADNPNYTWVDGKTFVQPDLCDPEGADCTQADAE